ncbi:uncharacterized protein LOC142788368 [Rhipicephalus microplus]|uniref:uncharacterized protein LOC142788368 n=1 Tax=Rhipicephalus microplus TaxID=6941 RepID=UPI003F6B5809
MNAVTVGVLAALSLLMLPQFIWCPFFKVDFEDLLVFLNTSFKIYIFTLNAERNKACPYYRKVFLNESYYVFNYTSGLCPVKTQQFGADLVNDTKNGPYMSIYNWTGTHTLKKVLVYHNVNEHCAIFLSKANGPSRVELHVWEITFSVQNFKKVYATCLSVYKTYISQLTDLVHECTPGCE